MKEPKTIKAYIKMMRDIEKMTIEDKKGFDSLKEEEKELIRELAAAISNRINELEI